jgi:hypothetical protein
MKKCIIKMKNADVAGTIHTIIMCLTIFYYDVYIAKRDILQRDVSIFISF